MNDLNGCFVQLGQFLTMAWYPLEEFFEARELHYNLSRYGNGRGKEFTLEVYKNGERLQPKDK